MPDRVINGGHFLFILLLTLVLCLSPAILKDADPIDLDEALDNLNSADTGVGLLPSGLSPLLWLPELPLLGPELAPYDPFFPLHATELLIGWAVLLRLKRLLLRPLKFLSNYVNARRFIPFT